MAMNLNDASRVLTAKQPDGFDRIAAVYQQMDAAYDAVAGHYGFVCQGCEDNCCRTRFRHHTLMEYAYLQRGFAGLEFGLRREIRTRSGDYLQALQDAEAADKKFRHWCPLNFDGRCRLYTFRPMICRLHGLPHILHHPARGLIQGPGCHIFEQDGQGLRPRPLERTALYQALAGLEQTARQKTGFSAPVGLTVAEMILTFTED
jgi:hypothetical protein